LATPSGEMVRPGRRGSERLCSEMRSAWDVVADLTSKLAEAASGLRGPGQMTGTLAGVRQHYESDTRVLLVEPVEAYLRLRPLRRSLEAMQEVDQEAPASSVKARARIDTRFQALLSKAALDLCEPWRIRRAGGHEDEWKAWEERRANRAKQAAALLAQYDKWAAGAGAAKGKDVADPTRQKRLDTWWRQQRDVNSLLEMEVALRELGLAWFDLTSQLVASIREERHDVFSIAHRMVDWIEGGAAAGSVAPVDAMQLATPDERLRGLVKEMHEGAESRLAEQSELVRPGRWTTWRTIKPRGAFLVVFETYCRRPMQEIVATYWEGTAAVGREASRAKEIIDYWREAALAHRGQEESLLADARHNAAVVLADQLQTPATEEELEPKLVDAFWSWSAEGSAALEAAQFGWIALLRQPRGRRLLHTTVRRGRRTAKTGLEHTGRWLADRWDRTLETLGGKLPPRPTAPPVVRRATLRDTLALPASKSELPTIYSSLFRLAPIEDRRFLVGRDQELDGLEQALRDWDDGRFAACLLVGGRGSGKTSLLNCAAAGAFKGREVIRGLFRERTLTPNSVERFLRQLIGAADDVDLEGAFASERRILMIEEAERTYLRKVSGFKGLAHLIRWIHRTAPTTLWVIAMNDKAFRVAEAAVNFGRVFSHRINAMNVSREHLENAIYERHRLSGLRLEFAPPPEVDPRISRLRQFLALDDSPQKLYFDSLFQQSGGVFRSAFELWLSSIERVEGETLKIRQPLEPAFAQFRAELAQEDHFTLMAIQEHGSLTQSEIAEVLQESEEMSRSRLDRLLALGLVEQDPEHIGLRVRPDATRFTNDVLRRVNLI
jgi:hypothetical protein